MLPHRWSDVFVRSARGRAKPRSLRMWPSSSSMVGKGETSSSSCSLLVMGTRILHCSFKCFPWFWSQSSCNIWFRYQWFLYQGFADGQSCQHGLRKSSQRRLSTRSEDPGVRRSRWRLAGIRKRPCVQIWSCPRFSSRYLLLGLLQFYPIPSYVSPGFGHDLLGSESKQWLPIAATRHERLPTPGCGMGQGNQSGCFFSTLSNL